MAWMAPIAAAGHQRKEEAELLKILMEEDPDGQYEFKIVRGSITTFRSDEYLQEMLDIENQGGWEFVENIDNVRVVLRRPVTFSRRNDNGYDPDYDPYRVHYDRMNPNAIAVIVGLLLLGGVIILTGILLTRQLPGFGEGENSSVPIIFIAIIIILFFQIVMVRMRRK